MLALLAVTGGICIYKVKLESVIKALYTALKQFTDDYKKTSHTPILQTVYMVNNSHTMTSTAAYKFQDFYSSAEPQSIVNPRVHRLHYHIPPAATNYRRQSDKRVEERIQTWASNSIRQKHEEDGDMKAFIQWFKDDSKPHWNSVTAQSPALKAYWHQLDSL